MSGLLSWNIVEDSRNQSLRMTYSADRNQYGIGSFTDDTTPESLLHNHVHSYIDYVVSQNAR